MNKNIELLLTVIVTANDQLLEKHQQISTIVGILEKNLAGSNAITVANIVLGQKLMFVILDAHPDVVGIGTGNIGTEMFSFIEQHAVKQLSVQRVQHLLAAHLVNA